jgi:hypothetical protein
MNFSSKLKKTAIGLVSTAIITGTPLVSKAESPIGNFPSKVLAPISQIKESQSKPRISLFGGLFDNGKDKTTSISSPAAQLEYSQGNYSISYLNEGHISSPEKHHRDGLVGQVWARKGYFSAGAGGYIYCDTTKENPIGEELNEHGLGAILSVNAEYPITKNLSGNIRTNFVLARGMNTGSILAGLSYSFGPEKEKIKENIAQEVTLFPLGFGVINSNRGGQSLAHGIEYRLNLGKNIDWTIGYVDEGERNGVNSQAWVVKKLNKISLGIGGGIYANSKDGVDGIASITASYDLSKKLDARFTWSRIVTNNDTDADLVLLGLGYKF